MGLNNRLIIFLLPAVINLIRVRILPFTLPMDIMVTNNRIIIMAVTMHWEDLRDFPR